MKTFLYNWVAGFILGYCMVKFCPFSEHGRIWFAFVLGIAEYGLVLFTWAFVKKSGIRL